MSESQRIGEILDGFLDKIRPCEDVTHVNPYLSPGMPLDRVKAEARHGVALAREALRQRDPEMADRLFGHLVERNSDHRRGVVAATRNFFRNGKTRPRSNRCPVKNGQRTVLRKG